MAVLISGRLVKDLASVFKTTGSSFVRSVSVMVTRSQRYWYLWKDALLSYVSSEFAPVSIKMPAKEQNPSLNQTKISGVCGRLMLSEEPKQRLEELNRNLPGIGDSGNVPQECSGWSECECSPADS